MTPLIKNILKLVFFLLLGLTIMYLLYQDNQKSYLAYCAQEGISLDQCSLFQKLKQDFMSLNYGWVALIFVGFGMTNYSRAKRWQIILDTLDYKTSFKNAYLTINLAYLANLALPRIGEFVRASQLAKLEDLPFDRVFGTVVVDRIADVVSFALLITLAFLLDFNTLIQFLNQYAHIPAIHFNYWMIGIALFFIGLIWFLRESISKLQAMRKMVDLLTGIGQGIASIKNLKRRNAFLLHTALIWVWFFLMFVFACKSFGPTAGLGLIPMFVVYIFGGLGVFIPSPGGMGTYHYLVIISLGMYGLQKADAFSFANIAFAWGQFFALLVFGTISAVLVSWQPKAVKIVGS